jgi:hypothetical protein
MHSTPTGLPDAWAQISKQPAAASRVKVRHPAKMLYRLIGAVDIHAAAAAVSVNINRLGNRAGTGPRRQ